MQASVLTFQMMPVAALNACYYLRWMNSAYQIQDDMDQNPWINCGAIKVMIHTGILITLNDKSIKTQGKCRENSQLEQTLLWALLTKETFMCLAQERQQQKFSRMPVNHWMVASVTRLPFPPKISIFA